MKKLTSEQLMMLDEYQAWTNTTAVYKESIPSDFYLAYCALKLSGEFGEVVKAMPGVEVKKELGDVAWYLAQLATLLEKPFSTLFIAAQNKDGLISTGLISASAVSEIVGKLLRDRNQGADRIYSLNEKLIDALLDCIRSFLQTVLFSGFTLEEILDGNQLKLVSRKSRGVLSGCGDDR